MNNDEQIAHKYLNSLDYTIIEHEPNGNVPPDFLLDKKIAVEIRRLNQHKLVNGKYIPLENLRFKLVQKFTNLLKEFETDTYNETIFASLSYGRPLKVNSKLFKQINGAIQNHLPLLVKELTIQLNNHLEMRLWRSDKKLKHIIPEKEEKIKKYQDGFKEWWLVLVDYIGHGLDDNDLQQLKDLHIHQTVFDKIVIVSPLDITRFVEVEIEQCL